MSEEYWVCVDGEEAVACSCYNSFIIGPFTTIEKAIIFQKESWDDTSVILPSEPARHWLMAQHREQSRKYYSDRLG